MLTNQSSRRANGPEHTTTNQLPAREKSAADWLETVSQSEAELREFV